MLSRQFRIIIVAIFLLTTTLIVVLQYNANKNINELVHGNENLLTEFKLRSRLLDLQNDLLSLDNNVRIAIIGKENSRLNIDENVSNVKAGVKELGELLVTDNSRRLWNQLNALAEEKIRFSYQVLDTLNSSGKEAAENLIKQRKSNDLSEAIENVSDKLDISRQNDLLRIIKETDANSLQAKQFQGILAIIAVFILMFTLWYVVSRIRRQLAMISMLNESEKKVREAALIKEHFIANMSHEIRTPLNAIIGFTRLLQKQPLEKNAAEYVNAISGSGENLLSIVNDVLDLSKIESGMMRIERSEIDIRELFDAAYNMFAAKAAEKKLSYTLHIRDDVPALLTGDPVRITQVAVNLISNAVKFTSKGFVSIHVSSAAINHKEVLLTLLVSDSGIGISAQTKEQIFDRFTQADEDTTRKYGGTGLGLSIVRQLVELMQGTIQLETTPGKGSRFSINLPLEIATGDTLQKTNSTGAHVKIDHSKATVLVVEDNPMNQSLMRHLLENWNISYEVSSNGKEALALLQQQHFDLILMDIQMPEMDGYTASKKIRDELHLNTPIIAMTAHAFAGEKEKCLRYGMNDYLPKPVREELLASLLNIYLPGDRQIAMANNHKQNHSHGFINLHYLEELANGNEDFKKNILQQFLVQAPDELAGLTAAFTDKSFASIRSRAHNLKTTISFLGLQEHLAADIETLENSPDNSSDNETLTRSFNNVLKVCHAAVSEAKNILSAME